jgi:predicted O-methyltransferase YrrM
MDPDLLEVARRAPGFMPEDEGLALYQAGLTAPFGPFVEIGSYCGKSAVYLGAAAREQGTVLYSIDHHRGSAEHQVGEEYYDPRVTDLTTGRVDTLPAFLKTIADASLQDVVIGMVARSEVAARGWGTPLGLVFIDGGHSEGDVRADYEGWAPHVDKGGLFVIHDVFPDPAEGGQAPFDVYQRALDTAAFREVDSIGSLRVLERVGEGL